MYKLIEFPEIQKYQDQPGFDENACLANDPRFLQVNDIGNSAYFVNTRWIKNQNNDRYYDEVSDFADLITVEEFQAHPKAFGPNQGSGYWVKDGKETREGVHESPQLDATHVAWYNK